MHLVDNQIKTIIFDEIKQGGHWSSKITSKLFFFLILLLIMFENILYFSFVNFNPFAINLKRTPMLHRFIKSLIVRFEDVRNNFK
jgi:hypothetical protein